MISKKERKNQTWVRLAGSKGSKKLRATDLKDRNTTKLIRMS